MPELIIGKARVSVDLPISSLSTLNFKIMGLNLSRSHGGFLLSSGICLAFLTSSIDSSLLCIEKGSSYFSQKQEKKPLLQE